MPDTQRTLISRSWQPPGEKRQSLWAVVRDDGSVMVQKTIYGSRGGVFMRQSIVLTAAEWAELSAAMS